jgi:hypothetical protein
MTLRKKQSLFAQQVALLIQQATKLGYEVTFAEAYRTPEQAALNAKSGRGIAKSLHTQRLAIDLNLFWDGKYLSDSEDHRPLGEWWERQHELACWGGRFNDGNHYSFTHGGRK